LDEGSFLYMPTTMPHAGVSETLDVLQKLDKAIYSVPEVESVVGKIGRAETPLDPAPLSMVETIINIIPKFAKIDGKIVRQWRDEIHSMDDIWDEIVKVAQLPGTTSAPKLQPIQTRLVMLQSGMRAPMGIKIKGPDLATIEQVGLDIELLLKNAPGVNPPTVFADRIVGKPYLEIEIDREKIARYGLHIAEVQKNIGIAIGGKTATQTVEGRKRFGVRIRYQRELRDELDDLANIRIKTPTGQQILLDEIAEIKYVRGPQMIKSEDSFLIGYVLFDKLAGFAEVDVVENAQQFLDEKIQSGELLIPDGVSFAFAGSYENQLRAEKKLLVILPISLLAILMILYFQFRRFSLVLLVFTGVFVAWSGGFILIWLYNQSWFLDFWGLRELFHIAPVNLSVAVWVGFLALFGIATDDGVLMGTILQQSFKNRKPKTHQEIREAVIFAGKRRVRPALMTTATTLLALVPILTSTGRGSDIMIPMAIPSFGGMALAVITIFVVPVLYSAIEERNFAE
ncbi:efflux RND transporter permease subunit, partial [bacterium]|nr:efflux RND transporter permease subunit [bacterium]